MKVNYNLKLLDTKLVKSRIDDVRKLLSCNAIESTADGYALKITGSALKFRDHALRLGERFCIRYPRKGSRAGIDWISDTGEFFVYIRYKNETFSRYVSIGFYPELSKIIEEMMNPFHGMWDWEWGEYKFTVTVNTRPNNLLGRLAGIDVATEKEVNFKPYIKELNSRVDSVVSILGRDKVWVMWA